MSGEGQVAIHAFLNPIAAALESTNFCVNLLMPRCLDA